MASPFSEESFRIALAAGGTGGHVMPAIALGEALKEIAPQAQLLFFSGAKEQEIRWYGQAGIKPVQLPAAPLRRGILGKWTAGVGLAKSIVSARQHLKAFNPDCAVGLGSYVAGAVLIASRTLRIPYVIHEANSLAGKANRLLARQAAAVATTYPNAFASIGVRRLVETGNPLRGSVLTPIDPLRARDHFGLDAVSPTLLVFGASQGARGLNQAVLDLLRRFTSPDRMNWQLLWITGAKDFDRLQAEAVQLPAWPRVVARGFVEEMGMAYAAADAVVCRASSSSLAECAAWGKPIIAVPFPYSAEDHQRHNAQYYANKGACIAIDERDLTADRLYEEATQILGNLELRKRMSEAAKQLARPNAAQSLAEVVLEIAQDRRRPIIRS